MIKIYRRLVKKRYLRGKHSFTLKLKKGKGVVKAWYAHVKYPILQLSNHV